MKIILVDAWKTFILPDGIFIEMYEMLEEFKEKKVVVTNANKEEQIVFGMNDIPYEIFSLSHNPEKNDPNYFKKFTDLYNVNFDELIYFEHNICAVNTAKKIGIKTFHYDKKSSLIELKHFIINNLN